ncbi:GAF domain-containing protein [Actinoplanes sp. GCM10030250]|uniref:GAF domain-containing protein n=1 Tax=Actinoplanes sp. GCM10030250 TaxID=3273376 RepID=UPI0036195CC2
MVNTVLHDRDRLRVVASLDLDNAGMRAELDVVAERMAQETGMPVAMASVVLGTAQATAGAFGLPGWLLETGGLPVEWAFCTRAVASGGPYVVSDARNDPVQSGNPLVTVEGVGCYAGIPITVADQVVGAACVLGAAAHEFTDDEMQVLRRAAAEITEIIGRYRS